ncbi:helix-turn-helix domain-containing protein [Chloroflexota bacterium]
MPVLNGYLNIVEAAEILGVHPGTVKRLCRERRLVAEKVHNSWLIHKDIVHDFANIYSGRRGRPQTNNRGICQFKEPKTSHSRRRVAMTPKLALFLREYRAEKESIHWQLAKPLTLDDLVFSSVEGKPLDPSILSHEFARIAK